MDNFFLPLDQRPPEATDWESPYCVNRELLLDTVDKLSRGETAQVPWYDFKNNKTGGYTPMEGSRGGHHHRRGDPYAEPAPL